jgi:dUTP pyrophosphatase
MKIKIKKLHPNAVKPKYAKENDAGMDLVATEIISETPSQITYGLGIAMEIPDGMVGLIFPRSSIRNTRLQLSNSVGVIDSGYRGELQATFNKIITTIENQKNDYKVGDRICQIIIVPHPIIQIVEVDELSESSRGIGGFGSTGK